jgi:probable phosphoglycerate mutase
MGARGDALRCRTVLYLMRHGETGLNTLHEIHGRIDDPLDEQGRAQAAALAELFAGVPLAAVYASPLRRAVQTAEPVAAAAGLTVVPDPDLMDRDYGPWTGHPKADVVAEFGAVDDAPGVEPWETFSDRVTAAFVALAERHAGQRVAVAAHDAVNQAVLGRLFPGRWPGPHAIPQRNGCWNNVARAEDAWQLHVLDAVPGDGHVP